MQNEREQDLMTINQSHQKLVGSIMVQNRELIHDLKTISRILDTSGYLDNISEQKLNALREILKPYSEINAR